jgi:hypothetical protein
MPMIAPRRMTQPFHDRAVADGDVVFDDRRRLALVNDAVVLDARARADDDRVGVLIRAQHRAEPDARILADRYVADQNRGRSDETPSAIFSVCGLYIR